MVPKTLRYGMIHCFPKTAHLLVAAVFENLSGSRGATRVA